jgi:GxxExxY protein
MADEAVLKLPPSDLYKLVLAIAADIFEQLGSGHGEAVYVKALGVGLAAKNIAFETERTFPIFYMNTFVGTCRPDLVVGKTFIVEVKAVLQISATHLTQLNRYLRLPKISEGIILNFGQSKVHDVHFFS